MRKETKRKVKHFYLRRVDFVLDLIFPSLSLSIARAALPTRVCALCLHLNWKYYNSNKIYKY